MKFPWDQLLVGDHHTDGRVSRRSGHRVLLARRGSPIRLETCREMAIWTAGQSKLKLGPLIFVFASRTPWSACVNRGRPLKRHRPNPPFSQTVEAKRHSNTIGSRHANRVALANGPIPDHEEPRMDRRRPTEHVCWPPRALTGLRSAELSQSSADFVAKSRSEFDRSQNG